jgi:hypothetical protein
VLTLRSLCSGATVKKGKLDVTDKDGMADFLLKVNAETPVECVSYLLSESVCQRHARRALLTRVL